jgi:death on curing protein
LPSEPFWLTSDEVKTTNREAVAVTGECYFVRDEGLLESAVAKPQNYWGYGGDDVVVLAVKLLLGIAQNHPFEQGNKRTALASAVMFLDLNGLELVIPDSEKFGEVVEKLITGAIPEEVFTGIVSACVREIPDEDAPDQVSSPD